MKYLKKFESFNWNSLRDIKIGDYVIIDSSKLSNFMIKNNVDIYRNFLNSNIGKIINISRVLDNIRVKYENIPDIIKDYFEEDNSIFLHPSKIKYFSKTIDDLKLKIDTDKFNL